MIKRRNFKPGKDMIIALLSALTIATTGIVAVQRDKINKNEDSIQKIQKEYKCYKEVTEKELLLRDEVLEKYRNHLDENDKLIEKKDKEIKELKKKIKNSKESPTYGTPVTLTLTFYGDFAYENGGYAGINAYGNKLAKGMVASNVHPRGTKFKLSSGETLTVEDRGGSNFNNYNRLDVFVPRIKGESDRQYAKRISNYGVKKVRAYKR